MRREPDRILADSDVIRREAGDETARCIEALARRMEAAIDDRGRIRQNFEVASMRSDKIYAGASQTYLAGPQEGALAVRIDGVLIADDAAIRLLPADIPDHGFCLLVGGDVNQSAFFFYDLGTGTTDWGVAIGATMSLDGNNARTGTDGTDTKINVGASAAGLDVENRAGGPITVAITVFGAG